MSRTTRTSRLPLVGVSTYIDTAAWGVWSRPAALLPATYVDAVAAAGGVPILLPPGGRDASRAVDAVDALVLAGGPDIDPATYGAPPHPKTANVQPARDRWELGLLAAAIERGVPVLGICRGMELMNVACGGDLAQHLADHGASANHRPAPGSYGWHGVRLDPTSLLAPALGAEFTVASYHHQGIGRLGSGLRPVGWADDGFIEAVELAGADFAVGVLWHPEEDAGPAGRAVFAALVEAAQRNLAPAGERGRLGS
jgi:putative glutamine amidotransferase